MKFIFFLIIVGLSFNGFSQSYFQQTVNHRIEVRLDDKTHFLHAFEEIEYTNNSQVTLDTIFMHLWPNAYASTFSEMGRQKFEDGELDFHFSDSKSKGYIDSLDFKIDGEAQQLFYHPKYKDIGILKLTKPVSPGQTIKITTPFRVKIPSAEYSRLGHVETSYMITQWFPKPAVFDNEGWHAMPYLGQGEFFSEYGSYDVSITLPKNYVVGATGDLQTTSEQKFLIEKDSITRAKIASKKLIQYNKAGYPLDIFPKSNTETKTIRYTQNNVHDFAWFADKRFHVLKSNVQLPASKRNITTWAMFTNGEADIWIDAPIYIDSATYYYSLWNGDYPYNQVTAVDGTIAAGGGMEYPNVTVIGRSGDKRTLETVIAHEVGHNWFYGILGSNERVHPWLDEGLNSLNENRYIETRYPKGKLGENLGIPSKLGKKFGLDEFPNKSMHEISYLLNARRNLDQPIEFKSRDYTPTNYGAMVYSKTAVVVDYLKAYLGDELFDKCMHSYYDNWEFKHPGPNDLRKEFETVSSKDLSWFFEDIINTTGKIDFSISRIKRKDKFYEVTIKNKGDISGAFSISQMKDGIPISTKWIDGNSFNDNGKFLINRDGVGSIDAIQIDPQMEIPEISRTNNTIRTKGMFKKQEPFKMQFLGGLESSKTSTLYWTPLPGWNKYDKFMLGASFYNHTFPEKKFNYTLSPMFSLGTLRPVGLGDIHFNIYPKKVVHRITYGLKYQTFHFQKNETSLGRFQATNPYLSIDFMGKNMRSKWKHDIDFNYHYIDEYAPSEIAVNQLEETHIASVSYILRNKQVLKPFSVKLKGEFGAHENNWQTEFQQFSKVSLEANWRLNYNADLDGIDLRLFAGTFFSHSVLTSRFNWQMAGNSGYQDYEYSSIFLGRNEPSHDFLSQQMTETDGAFKVPTGFGSSNKWILAANIKIDLPIPLIGLYADAGIYPVYQVTEETYRTDFLYNAGIHIPIRKGILDFYIPIVFSDQIKKGLDFKDINFWQTIRFSLNLNQINPFKMLKEIEP